MAPAMRAPWAVIRWWMPIVSVKPIDKLAVVFGIKNLLDRNPPFTNAYQNNFAAGYNSKLRTPWVGTSMST